MADSAELATKKGRRFRLSLAMLLFLVACFAGYLSGFRLGADASAEQQRRATVTTQVYSVSDLIKPVDSQPGWSATEEDFAPLIDLVISTIAAGEWEGDGGSGTNGIHPFVQNSAIVVTCSGGVHDEVADLLQQLRRQRSALPADYLQQVREVANRRLPTRQIIKAFTTTSPAYHQEMENLFSSAMAELEEEFGQPSLVAAASDKEFPQWLAAQRAAVWDRGIGKLYFALVDCRPEGEALMAGWWEEGRGALEPIVLAANP